MITTTSSMEAKLSAHAHDGGSFGPIIGTGGRADGFDFTLIFEQSIFTLIPAVIFLFAFPTRLFYLAKKDIRTSLSVFRIIKLVKTDPDSCSAVEIVTWMAN